MLFVQSFRIQGDMASAHVCMSIWSGNGTEGEVGGGGGWEEVYVCLSHSKTCAYPFCLRLHDSVLLILLTY